MKEETKPAADKVTLSVNSVVDEVIGAATAGAGIIGGSYGMQLIRDKAKLNPWLVSAGGFLLGFGGRIGAGFIKNKQVREVVKDFSTGVMTAGVLDGAKKAVDVLFPTADAGSATAKVKAAIPSLSGNDTRNGAGYGVPSIFSGVRGLRGPVNSNILNGDGAAPARIAVNSNILN
jgi:hypothetical protein